MIKQRKTKCWIVCCDNCGAEMEEGDLYTPHYDTKEEAEEFVRDYLEDWEGNQILCDNCRAEGVEK